MIHLTEETQLVLTFFRVTEKQKGDRAVTLGLGHGTKKKTQSLSLLSSINAE